jgi:hypothetical protein
MGSERASVLKETIIYFNEFLEMNFDSITLREDKIIEFLHLIMKDGYSPDFNWQFIPGNNKKLLEEFEKSGLRRDIWIYGKEVVEEDLFVKNYVKNYINKNSIDYIMRDRGYEIIEDVLIPLNIDSAAIAKRAGKKERYNNTVIFTDFSLTMYGFDMYPSNEYSIQKYKETKFTEGSTGGVRKKLVDAILLFDTKSFKDPYCDIILVMDFFYPLMEINKND